MKHTVVIKCLSDLWPLCRCWQKEIYHSVGLIHTLARHHNGTVLGVIELFGKFDKIMQEHIRKAQNKEIPDHYLGRNIQNELVDIMGKSVQREIISRIKTAKYYAIIIDYISHQ